LSHPIFTPVDVHTNVHTAGQKRYGVVCVVGQQLMGRAVKVGEAEVPDVSGAEPLTGRTDTAEHNELGRPFRPAYRHRVAER
jgi:hypothetical protein